MKIAASNNYSINNNASFRASIPVVHWVAEANGSYAPEAELKLVKKLQSKIVRVLNKQLSKSAKPMDVTQQKLRAYIASCDINYRNKPQVRSFYNRVQGSTSEYSPVSYLITGEDVNAFEEIYAKEIGRQKSKGKELLNTPYTPEAVEAIKAYNQFGLDFVNENSRRIKDKKNQTYVLHTKFEIIRNKEGKVKDFRYVDARFLPEFGPESPFERLKRNS